MNLRNYIVCFLALPLIAGCVKPGHIKFREAPKYNLVEIGSYELAIDKMFAISGNFQGNFNQSTIDNYTESNIKVTKYLFPDISNGTSNVRKAIMLSDYQIKDPRFFYRSEVSFDSYSKRHIDKGITEVNGIRCAYLIRQIYKVSQDVTDLASSQGYHISKDMKYGIEIILGKIIGKSRMMHIIYAEGSTINYENNYAEAHKILEKFKSYIMLSK